MFFGYFQVSNFLNNSIMCLWIKDLTSKIADKDIICYKVCYEHNYSYISEVFGFEYGILEEYDNGIKLKEDLDFIIDRFKDPHAISINDSSVPIGKNLFHSYKKTRQIKSNLDCGLKLVLLKCIIPKGAYYFEDKNCYASSQIKILEEI